MHGEAVSSALPSAQLEVVSSPELARHGGSSIAPVCSARSQANRLGDGIMDTRQYMACGSVWSMDKTYQFGCWGKIVRGHQRCQVVRQFSRSGYCRTRSWSAKVPIRSPILVPSLRRAVPIPFCPTSKRERHRHLLRQLLRHLLRHPQHREDETGRR